MIILGQSLVVAAADVRVIVANPLRAVFGELGPQFERDTGHKLTISVVGSPAVKRAIDAGNAFDVAVTSTSVIDEMVSEGKLVAATRAPVAYARLGVGVRAGSRKPQVSTVESLKRALLNARSVAHSAEGSSSAYVKSLFGRLDIADQMMPKLKPMSGAGLLENIANGEDEMVVVSIPTIDAAPGVELAGSLPSELQTAISFAAGVVAGAREPEAALALIRHLTGPRATATLKSKGWEPGAPP